MNWMKELNKGIIKLEKTIIQLNTEIQINVSITRIMDLRLNYFKEYWEIWVKFPVLCKIKKKENK